MPFAEVTDGQLYYEIHGDGPPLVLITGLGGVADFWRPHLAALARTNKVIIYDHRGTGQSTKSPPPYTVDAMADDVIALMDVLNIDAAHIFGHSTGGAIGQILGARFPQRVLSLLLAATWGHRDPFFKRCFDARLPVLHALGPKPYVELTSLLLFPPSWISEHYDEMLAIEARNAAALLHVDILESRIHAICNFEIADELHKITAPTLIVCARDDMTTAAFFSDKLHKLIAGSELRTLDWGGHFFPHTAQPLFARIMREWLAAR
jgi:aminoacrylate hydrolase